MVSHISLRRSFLCLVLLICFLFLAVNVHQRELWARKLMASDMATSSQQQQSHGVPHLRDDDQLHQLNEMAEHSGQSVVPSNPIDELQELLKEEEARPWYMKGGTKRPLPAVRNPKTGRRLARLWPHEDPGFDRITNQLMFVPPSQSEGELPHRLKKILVYNSLGKWVLLKSGRDAFIQSSCPVDTCTITTNKAEAAVADAILYKDHFVNPGYLRHPRQVWILYFLEGPYHTKRVKFYDVFNWTATYRRDSDIVTPYARWSYYDKKIFHLDHNYAANKTKKVAWFVSNCEARNKRLQYAHELKKHISVDIYGACGTHSCPRSMAAQCFDILDKDYKFYLSFENSNCKDYITEKFFVNGLRRNILPVVMGARPEDYARTAPYRSYIHVDEFESPKELAAYLHRLDADDDLYNSYFRWKGTGEFINMFFFCRLCALLHDDYPNKSYSDVNDWWRGPGTCTDDSWKKANNNVIAPAVGSAMMG